VDRRAKDIQRSKEIDDCDSRKSEKSINLAKDLTTPRRQSIMSIFDGKKDILKEPDKTMRNRNETAPEIRVEKLAPRK
jgi:hypothetical protein